MKNYSFEVSTRENLSTLLAYFYFLVSCIFEIINVTLDF